MAQSRSVWSGGCYLFELAAVAGINDGVQAAVEVSEPKDNSEEGFRRPQSGVKRAFQQTQELKQI